MQFFKMKLWLYNVSLIFGNSDKVKVYVKNWMSWIYIYAIQNLPTFDWNWCFREPSHSNTVTWLLMCHITSLIFQWCGICVHKFNDFIRFIILLHHWLLDMSLFNKKYRLATVFLTFVSSSRIDSELSKLLSLMFLSKKFFSIFCKNVKKKTSIYIV